MADSKFGWPEARLCRAEGIPFARSIYTRYHMPHAKPLCKILTVDDQMGIDSFFYEFFSVRNYEVFNATSGKEAIRLVEKERPKIVLLDINMGRGMDGIEVLKQIKAIDKNIVVIMVTGVKDDDTINKALDAGADDYITKPLSLEYLEKVVLLKFVNSQIKELGRDMA